MQLNNKYSKLLPFWYKSCCAKMQSKYNAYKNEQFIWSFCSSTKGQTQRDTRNQCTYVQQLITFIVGVDTDPG